MKFNKELMHKSVADCSIEDLCELLRYINENEFYQAGKVHNRKAPLAPSIPQNHARISEITKEVRYRLKLLQNDIFDRVIDYIEDDKVDNLDIAYMMIETLLQTKNVVVANLWGGDKDIQGALDNIVHMGNILVSVKQLIDVEREKK